MRAGGTVPNFNTHSLYLAMHLIRGLSDIFLSGDDDVIFFGPTRLSTFVGRCGQLPSACPLSANPNDDVMFHYDESSFEFRDATRKLQGGLSHNWMHWQFSHPSTDSSRPGAVPSAVQTELGEAWIDWRREYHT